MTQTPVEQERPLRVCDVCFQVDDHPRHQIANPIGAVPVDYEGLKTVLRNVDAQTDAGGKVIADFLDTSTQLRHLDCCRASGCPDGTCDAVTSGAESLKGEELQRHLESRTPDQVETVFVGGIPHGVVVDQILDATDPVFKDPTVGQQNPEA